MCSLEFMLPLTLFFFFWIHYSNLGCLKILPILKIQYKYIFFIIFLSYPILNLKSQYTDNLVACWHCLIFLGRAYVQIPSFYSLQEKEKEKINGLFLVYVKLKGIILKTDHFFISKRICGMQ